MSIEELNDILLSQNPSNIIIKKEKEIFTLIPELEICKGFKQNNDWHIYDVYDHILHVIDNVPVNLTLRLAALFHDIGKPHCYKEDKNGIGHFYGHWNISKEIFEKFAERNSLNKELTDLVANLIHYHDLDISRLDDIEINNLFSVFDSKEITMLYELKRADLLAQNKKYHYILNNYEQQKKLLLNKFKITNLKY